MPLRAGPRRQRLCALRALRRCGLAALPFGPVACRGSPAWLWTAFGAWQESGEFALGVLRSALLVKWDLTLPALELRPAELSSRTPDVRGLVLLFRAGRLPLWD